MSIPDGVQEQVMSPRAPSARLRDAVLEGEDRGPFYGSMQPGQGQGEQSQQAVIVNGVVPTGGPVEPTLDATTGSGDATRVQHTDPLTLHAHEQAAALQPSMQQQAAAASAFDLVSPPVEQVHQHVTMGELTFSPPEEIPSLEGDREHPSGQPVWIMRLGEFLQRRVTQAGAMMTPLLEARSARSSNPPRTSLLPPRSWSGNQAPGLFSPEAERTMQQWASQAPLLHGPQHQQGSDSSTGSLTREQVLQEVQRQVAEEMQLFSQQRSLLEAENQRLRNALEHAVRDRPAQVMDRHEGRGQGNPLGSQGSAPSALVEGRGDNPPGLCPQNPSRLGRGSLLSEGGPHKASGGQGLQPPSAAEHVGGGVGVEHGPQGSFPRNARASGPQQQGMPRPSDPLGLLVQGMTQLQSVVSESLMSRAKDRGCQAWTFRTSKTSRVVRKLSYRCGGLAPRASKSYGRPL